MSDFLARAFRNLNRLPEPFTRGERDFSSPLAASIERDSEYALVQEYSCPAPSAHSVPVARAWSPARQLLEAAANASRRLKGRGAGPTPTQTVMAGDDTTPPSSANSAFDMSSPSSRTSPQSSRKSPTFDATPSPVGADAPWPTEFVVPIEIDMPDMCCPRNTPVPLTTVADPAVQRWIRNLNESQDAKYPLPEDDHVFVALALRFMDKPLEHGHWLFFGDHAAGLKDTTLKKMDRLIQRGIHVEGTEAWRGYWDAFTRVTCWHARAHAQLYREGVVWYWKLNCGSLPPPPPEPKPKRSPPKAKKESKGSSPKRVAIRTSKGRKRAAPSDESADERACTKKANASSVSPAAPSKKRARADDDDEDGAHEAKRMRASSSASPAIRRSTRVAARTTASPQSHATQSPSPLPVQPVDIPLVTVTAPTEYAESQAGGVADDVDLDVEMAEVEDVKPGLAVEVAPALATKRTRRASTRQKASPKASKAPRSSKREGRAHP